MEVIASRLNINTVLLIWVVIAALGMLTSVLTLLLMRYEIQVHPHALQIPAVARMKRHNQFSEVVRLCVQVIAVLMGVLVIAGVLPGIAIAWVLAAMNSLTVSNSANELLLTARMVLRGSDNDDHGGQVVRVEPVQQPGGDVP